MNRLILYTDGGARGNPGPAAIGIVIYDENHSNILKNIGMKIGRATNNQAEYKALIRGLEEALKLGATEVVCHLDSELVVKQMQGKYKVRDAGLQDLAPQVLRLKNKFKNVDFVHVKREKNKLADKLVNEALDIEK
jgi:ribonuclease HI